MTGIPRGRHIVEFLASRPEFVGVGKATATRLWQHFGSALYSVLGDGDVERLSTILDRNQASIVVSAWRNQQALADCIVFFDEHGIDRSVAKRAVIFWGDRAVVKIRENPFRLLSICPWETVDRTALALGFGWDDTRRLVAAVESVLYDRLDRKHTWSSRGLVLERTAHRLQCSAEVAEAALAAAVSDGAAIPTGAGFQPAGAAYMERFVEGELESRLDPHVHDGDFFLKHISTKSVDAFLERYQHLSEEQRQAVRMALTSGVSVLVGGAGVGKTTTLKALNDACRALGLNVYQIAVAGRAANRMAEATGRPAQTIASWLLGVANGKIEVGRHTMVIVDEASMVDLPTMYRILFHLPAASRILLVGDVAQLPPIGFGLTLHRLATSERIPRCELSRILRASEASGIPETSRSIRRGSVPFIASYDRACSGVSFAECAVAQVVARLEDVINDLPEEEIQIIAPTYAGAAGVDAINAYFHALNKRGKSGTGKFSEGDPCIWLVNDYERRLWNGSLGRVVGAGPDGLTVVFDDALHRIPKEEFEKLDLAYCISVHKAQGSQFRNVIVPLQPSRLLDRAMIYTAVTRAIDRVILVGGREIFSSAVMESSHSHRREVALLAN